ncbi:serine--tRNA ligase, mitochondrial-like [Oxyura jamaicensis]|uniref:serine--tRNA ligase, mitochondrial-like n=1 Tax=Oxyura jamaicensis TaxID=8884 RepID=UPI0015A607B1|nr:serine--tRNA ligase, mitochondrial-like [Oxyura jamaicensis]
MAAPRVLLAAARRVAAAAAAGGGRGRRAAGGVAGRSRLYEHAREGLSARPRLDVEALSGHELERRRGPLREGDLRDILQTWARLGEVRAAIARLEAQKDAVAQGVRALVVSAPNCPQLSPNCPQTSAACP